MTQKGMIPAKDMTIITTGGLVPRMEIKVTRPACKVPRESDADDSKNRNRRDGRKMEQNDDQQTD